MRSPDGYLAKLPKEEADNIRAMMTPAYQAGFQLIFIVGAALAAFAFVLAVFLMPQVGLQRPDDEALKAEGKKRVQGQSDEERNEKRQT